MLNMRLISTPSSQKAKIHRSTAGGSRAVPGIQLYPAKSFSRHQTEPWSPCAHSSCPPVAQITFGYFLIAIRAYILVCLIKSDGKIHTLFADNCPATQGHS